MTRLAPLRALADHLRDGAPLPEADRLALAEGLDRLFAGEAANLDEALALRPASSQGRSARTMAVLAERDRLLREAAARFLPDLPPSAQAEELRRRWVRYAASGWRRERDLEALPAARAGTLEGQLWAVLKMRDHVLADRQLRAILAMGSAYSLPAPAPRVGRET